MFVMLAKNDVFFSAASCKKRHHLGEHDREIFGSSYFITALASSRSYLEIIFKALHLSTDVAVHAFCYSFHNYITTIPHHDHVYIYKVRAHKTILFPQLSL